MKLSTVQLLLANGADPNITNNRGETARNIAEFIQPDQQQNFINALMRKFSILIVLAFKSNNSRNRNKSYSSSEANLIKSSRQSSYHVLDAPRTVSPSVHAYAEGKQIGSITLIINLIFYP